MKNCLTNLFNAFNYRHILRMVIICVCVSYSAAVNADNSWSGKATFTAKVSNTGGGKIYISETNTTPADETVFTDTDQKQEIEIGNTDGLSSSATRFFHAKPNSDEYTFVGWSTSPSEIESLD